MTLCPVDINSVTIQQDVPHGGFQLFIHILHLSFGQLWNYHFHNSIIITFYMKQAPIKSPGLAIKRFYALLYTALPALWLGFFNLPLRDVYDSRFTERRSHLHNSRISKADTVNIHHQRCRLVQRTNKRHNCNQQISQSIKKTHSPGR